VADKRTGFKLHK